MHGGRRLTVEELLAEARRGLPRVDAASAHRAMTAGAILVDVRSDAQLARDGRVPGAVRIQRNVLEWRADPDCEHRDERIARRDVLLLILCNEGYQSSLAAANLRRLGLEVADVIGGFQAWRGAGLPVAPAPNGAEALGVR